MIPFPVLQSPHLALSCLSQLALQNVFMWKEAVILFCGQRRITLLINDTEAKNNEL
jgi:hypothetical protein